MSLKQKIAKELKEIGLVTLYFLFSFGLILFMKKLILASYKIDFFALSKVVVGALVVAKVVIILNKTPFGNRFQGGPLYLDVLYKSFIYTFVVFLVAYLERTIHLLREAGGFMPAIVSVYESRDMPHFWAAIIWIALSFIGYNTISGINRRMGEGELFRLFFSAKSSS